MGGGYTQSVPAPSPGRLFLCFLLLSALVFLRPPTTNFIFDEQEALLGNPYLNGSSAWMDAFHVDFWGRVPERTIGSYRPLPNLLWWPLRATLQWNTPWVLSLLNLLLHAATATVLSLSLVRFGKSQRRMDALSPTVVWLAGAWFVVSATSAEAVCSVVGIADVLVGFFSAGQLMLLLTCRGSSGPLQLGRFSLAVFLCTLLGLLSKETMLASLIWVPLLSFLLGTTGQRKPALWVLPLISALATSAALGVFVFVRASCFPADSATAETFVPVGGDGLLGEWFTWFQQPKLPVDPLNNPLLLATPGESWATGLRLTFEQVVQIVAPFGLNADHSFPRETVTGWGVAAMLGAGILLCAAAMVGVSVLRAMSARVLLAGCGAALFLATYLPISNLLILLPTIRGDRLLYTPSLGIALVAAGLIGNLSKARRSAFAALLAYLAFHAVLGRLHALDYRDDVSFWRATSAGNPASAKSHLNLGVMIGARGNEAGRLLHTERAVELAPDWPMGLVYLGDVHCRLKNFEAAWNHYRRGFAAAPNSKALTALGLQCLWDAGEFSRRRAALLELALRYPDTWLDYFVTELSLHGEEHGGIVEKYRPRKYNARASVR